MAFYMALAYTADGWDSFEKILHTLAQEDQEAIIKLCNSVSNTDHIVNDNWSHCLRFDNIDPTNVALYVLTEYIPSLGMDENQYYFFALDTDTGVSESKGKWNPNEFDIKAVSYLFTDFSGNITYYQGSGLTVQAPPSVGSNPTQVVNDYTCHQCGNSRCSSTEDACWKCGTAIMP